MAEQRNKVVVRALQALGLTTLLVTALNLDSCHWKNELDLNKLKIQTLPQVITEETEYETEKAQP